MKYILEIPDREHALPGRSESIVPDHPHRVSGRSLLPPYPDGAREVLFGMGCFWGAERLFWRLDGVWVTAVGYAGGHTPNPYYEEVCSGRTGHAEVVRVIHEPARIDFASLLRVFWEGHDPTQGMRQGNDIGTQYRSAIYVTGADQLDEALRSRAVYAQALRAAGRGEIGTEIREGVEFWFAEDAHQQYLARVPGGYCGLGGTGVRYPRAARAD
ncbi:MAG: peptide-methionine (S)-S-oxide reductase MsrA [Gammaproteobacteria bacterium]|jgi:peptide-methionine (S)-S-oxide reductase|nr:peptide-methionine (S)-S-oxide reductase MsrA [Gammaproteobacteria bacterium]